MAETTDIARLVTRLEVSMAGYERSMARANSKANHAAGGVERRFGRMNRRLASSGRQLERVFTRSFGAILALAAPVALGRVVTQSLAAAEAIKDLSDRADVSAEFLQEMRFVTSQNGASTRDWDDAISRLNRRLGLFIQNGGGPAALAFERLGLKTRIAAGELTDAESVFDAAVTAMQGIENQAERSALASQLFGEDSGPRLLALMSLGTQGMDEQREAARELGVVMSQELIDKAATASDTLERMQMQFSTEVNSAIAANADELVSLADALAAVAKWAIEAGGSIGDFFGVVGDAVAQDPLDKQISRLQRYRERQQAELERQNDAASANFDSGRYGLGDNALRERAEAIRALEATDRLLEELIQRQAQIRAREAVSTPAEVGIEATREFETPSAPAPRLPRRANLGETDEIPIPTLHPERQAEAFVEAMERLSATKRLQSANADAKAQFDAIEARREDFREFFTSGFRDGILAALDGNAGEALSSWWREYITRAMSDVLESLADRVFDIFTQSGGDKGSSLLSSAAKVFGGFKATGGNVAAGKAYTVGERGRERFVPNVAGRIIPHTGALTPGRATITYAPRYEIDARGATPDAIALLNRKIDATRLHEQATFAAKVQAVLPGAIQQAQRDGVI
jgi:hypothetical protein